MVPVKEQQALLSQHSPLQATKRRRKKRESYWNTVIENGSEKTVGDMTPERKGEFGDEKSAVMFNQKEGDDFGEVRLFTPKGTRLGKRVTEDRKSRKASKQLTNVNRMKGKDARIGETTRHQDLEEFGDEIGSRQAPGQFTKAQIMKGNKVKAKPPKIKGVTKAKPLKIKRVTKLILDLDEFGKRTTRANKNKPSEHETTAWQRRTRIELLDTPKGQGDKSQRTAPKVTNLKHHDRHHHHQHQPPPSHTITSGKSSPVPSSDIHHLLSFLQAKFKSKVMPSRKLPTSSSDGGTVRWTKQEEELKKKGNIAEEEERELEEEKTEEEKELEKSEEKQKNKKEIENIEQEEDKRFEVGNSGKGKGNEEIGEEEKKERKREEAERERETEQENGMKDFERRHNEEETKKQREKEEIKQQGNEKEAEEEAGEDMEEEEKRRDKGVPNSGWREMLAWHQQKQYVQYLEKHSDPRIPPWTGLFVVSKSAPPVGVLAPSTEPYLSYGSMVRAWSAAH